MTTHVMIDIETIGTAPGSVIASIAAVAFRPGEVIPDRAEQSRDGAFFQSVDISDCADLGLTVDAETLLWWLDQPDVARQQLEGGDSLSASLNGLRQFINRVDADLLWGNSPKFDMTMLERGYDAIGMPAPWEFYELRDYRTLTGLSPALPAEVERAGVEHHALDDAYHQARVAAEILGELEDQYE